MDQQHAENTKRIAKNTLMLYVRMLFSMLVSLYTSRVVLQALGVEDYGIYNVVGGFVAMFSLISGALSHSAGRFLTFELGRGDLQRLKDTFSTSLLIHFALAAVVLVLAETVGVWFLNTQMTIPLARLTAANWVFQGSVVAFVFSLINVPYGASIVAHERMSAFAYIGILDVVMRLLIVLLIAYVPLPFDKLVVYALLLVAVNIALRQIYWWYCRRNFEECRLSWRFNKQCWKEMWSFTSWNFIGGTALVLKDHGVNILLNLFTGPIVNAARGIALSVNSVVTSFAGNFMTALNPQLTKSYAVGDFGYLFKLMECGTRFSIYIVLVLALPILLETDFILSLWLGHYPEHTVNFVRIVLVLAIVDMFSNTIATVQSATGRIRRYQIVIGGMLLLNFPLSYIFLKLGFQPECTMFVALFVSICCLFLRLKLLGRNIDLSVSWFLRKVVCNVLVVALFSFPIPYVLYLTIPYGWLRFCIVCILCLVFTLSSVLILGCSKSERLFIFNKLKAFKNRLSFVEKC